MVSDVDHEVMIAIFILIAVIAFFGLAVWNGADSRHVEHGRHRTNLL